ncbi:hypothetical protein GCK72_014977 [Caenorhabditis remanei]|uniref:Uncharacterized protein n=1 Tax=Caenorhabditis remanei TaxID=31234 RepID=A0A6A5GVF0_CAERE|nr:hypothetical protein GCK72_014977 [Caenorhabditis remanei]KAF1758519.1 hypothetical protein GCK72_014977 [Caenorhabditis remanei]
MYNYSVAINDEYCKIMFPGAFHPAFQLVKVYHILLSIVSMFSITYFFVNYNNQLAFHFNIKILFYYQFLTCFTQSTTLAISQVIVPALTCLYMYYDDEFNYPQMSAMATSPYSLVKINYIFISVNVMNFITLMHSIGLYRHNQRKINVVKNRDQFILSSRFQMNENIISSRLLWWLSTAQLIIFLSYGCLMYSLRIFLTGPRSAVWQAVTELCYTPPLYCAIMPIICIISAQNSLKERNSKIQSLITLRSVGKEGWDNYQGMLQKQWA